MLVESVIVARVRPRTSKGITDLLLPLASTGLDTDSPSKKLRAVPEDARYYLARRGLVR